MYSQVCDSALPSSQIYSNYGTRLKKDERCRSLKINVDLQLLYIKCYDTIPKNLY